MENFEKLLSNWQLHPVADHFSIALLVVAVLVDIAAALFSQRLWLRYTAVLLMVLGAASAAASYWTGHIEAERIWDLVGNPAAKDVLKEHARYGYYLMYVFAVLALWRILIQAFVFMARTRQVYLALAIIAVAGLLYQGRLGGELVFTYGVGTGPMSAGGQKAAAAEVPAATESTAPVAPTGIATVYVPTEVPTAAPTAAPTEAAPTEAPTAAPSAPAPEKSAPAPAEPSARPSV
jgi:uncharacterized membrane protein